MELLLTLMMSHGLACLLLAMPKYNKQVSGFEKREKMIEKAFAFSGWCLIVLACGIAIKYFGVANGLVWICALLTLTASLLCLLFSFKANYTASFVTFLPVKVLGLGISSYTSVVYLPIYLIIYLCFNLFIA